MFGIVTKYFLQNFTVVWNLNFLSSEIFVQAHKVFIVASILKIGSHGPEVEPRLALERLAPGY